MLFGGDDRRRRRDLGACCDMCGLSGLGDNGAALGTTVTAPSRLAQVAVALGLIASAITIGKFVLTTSGRKKVKRARYIGHRVGRWDRGRHTLELPAESMADVVFERRR
jgi:hypothetical protein